MEIFNSKIHTLDVSQSSDRGLWGFQLFPQEAIQTSSQLLMRLGNCYPLCSPNCRPPSPLIWPWWGLLYNKPKLKTRPNSLLIFTQAAQLASLWKLSIGSQMLWRQRSEEEKKIRGGMRCSGSIIEGLAPKKGDTLEVFFPHPSWHYSNFLLEWWKWIRFLRQNQISCSKKNTSEKVVPISGLMLDDLGVITVKLV